MIHVEGFSESLALLQVWSPPPNAPSKLELGKLGLNAIVFTGGVDLQDVQCLDEVKKKKQALDEGENSTIDDPFTWELDVTVGPVWRKVVQVAPLVVVTDMYSSNSDEDDQFQAGVEFRFPKWSEVDLPPRRIVLHLRVKQAGEFLTLHKLSYSVTATGDLLRPEDLMP